MKKTVFIFVFSVLWMACSDKKNVSDAEETYVAPQYDTTAIDSFSAGAVSEDVAAQIRMSSQEYQDSLKQAALVLEQEKQKKAAEEKKKADEKPATEKQEGKKPDEKKEDPKAD